MSQNPIRRLGKPSRITLIAWHNVGTQLKHAVHPKSRQMALKVCLNTISSTWRSICGTQIVRSPGARPGESH
jgi:hypothetical protein